MKRWPNEIVVVGEPARGLAKLLSAGLSERVSCKVTSVDIYALENGQLFDPMPDLIFFAIDQENLFQPEDGPLHARTPIQIVQAMWDTLDKELGLPIHVAIPERSDSFSGFTALDTLAFLLSGAAGVWELGVTFLDEAVANQLEVQRLHEFWIHRAYLLYGQPLIIRLYEFWDRILGGDWPFSIEQDDEKDVNVYQPTQAAVEACFHLSLGIADLPVSELSIRASDGNTMVDFANYLMELQDYTGVYMGRTVIPKHIGRLERGWRERVEMYDKSRRFEMPLWAQADGFPQQIPLVRGVNPHETAALLYEALDWIEFRRDWTPYQDKTYTTITLPDLLRRR